jgi:hypothetical protein
LEISQKGGLRYAINIALFPLFCDIALLYFYRTQNNGTFIIIYQLVHTGPVMLD